MMFDGICELRSFLNQHFEMKDFGHLIYFLSLEVLLSDFIAILSLKPSTPLLSRAGLTDAKIVAVPIEANLKLRPTDGV